MTRAYWPLVPGAEETEFRHKVREADALALQIENLNKKNKSLKKENKELKSRLSMLREVLIKTLPCECGPDYVCLLHKLIKEMKKP